MPAAVPYHFIRDILATKMDISSFAPIPGNHLVICLIFKIVSDIILPLNQ